MIFCWGKTRHNFHEEASRSCRWDPTSRTWALRQHGRGRLESLPEDPTSFPRLQETWLHARILISGESDATDQMWAKATDSVVAKVTETTHHDQSQSSIAVQETQTAGVSGDTITRDLPNTNNTGERRSDHCPLCNANFRDQSQLWRHINLEHIARRIFPLVDFLVAHGRHLCSEPSSSFAHAHPVIAPVSDRWDVATNAAEDF